MGKWFIKVYIGPNDQHKDIRISKEFEGTLESALHEAHQIVTGCGAVVVAPDDPSAVFTPTWTVNDGYKPFEVWNRGYKAPDGYGFAIAYVGEVGWNTEDEAVG